MVCEGDEVNDRLADWGIVGHCRKPKMCDIGWLNEMPDRLTMDALLTGNGSVSGQGTALPFVSRETHTPLPKEDIFEAHHSHVCRSACSAFREDACNFQACFELTIPLNTLRHVLQLNNTSHPDGLGHWQNGHGGL